jgi:RNA polymerase sigma factor (sigma-70 family)
VTEAGTERVLTAALERLRADYGHAEAWTEIYTALWPYAYAAAFRVLKGDASSAEDVAQGVFLRLLRGDVVGRIPDAESLRAYIGRMAQRGAIDLLRGAHLPGNEADPALSISQPDPAPSPEALLLRDELLARLTAGLSDPERGLLLLLIQGYSGIETAERLGISHRAARVRIHRLRQKLGALLQ